MMSSVSLPRGPAKRYAPTPPPARHHRRAHQAIVERRRDHRRLPVARGARDDQSAARRWTHRVRDSRRRARRPRPSRQDAPVVAGVGGKETRVAERPAAVHVPQRRVLGAVVGIEQHERVAALEHSARCVASDAAVGGVAGPRPPPAGAADVAGAARCGGGRPHEQQHVLAASLIRALRQARQHRSAGRGPALEDHRGERATLDRREHADVEAERGLRDRTSGARGDIGRCRPSTSSEGTSRPFTFPGGGGICPTA